MVNKHVAKIALLAFSDIMITICAYGFALLVRFEMNFNLIDKGFLKGYVYSITFWALSVVVVYYGCKLYHSVWRLASVAELEQMIFAQFLLVIIHLVAIWFMNLRMPRSYYLMGFLITAVCTTCTRFSYRILRYQSVRRSMQKDVEDNIMIIGGGAAGYTLIREIINSSHLNCKISCVIDDNPVKKGRMLDGIPIVGCRYDIPEMVRKYKINHIIFAIPTADAQTRKEILNICKDTGCKMQVLPGVYQLVNGEINVSKLRNVEITDLLGREPVKVNNREILDAIMGKVVMVTGGGGSIGSGLCRQIAAASPKMLIIFDIYENNAYEIQQELKRKYPELKLEVIIGSVRDKARINSVMEQYRPFVVYHAAAHKHVPLMEDSPNEAIKNNVFGTYNTAEAAARNGVKRFVLISTDKAVNPTNIMGASKRLCEMVVQMENRRYPDTEFVAVRFGNVLGSNGSVIPLFKQQIAEGGPVTVTHKDIIRYFMTIPEAVSLVIQASYYAKGGEIFVLDMGDPVRIDDMARNLIRLSGYKPDEDIKIVYTGLRPGEKLYEELLMDEEGLQNTAHSLIHVGKPIEMDDEIFMRQLAELKSAAEENGPRIKELVAEVVPTYHPQ